MEMPIETDFEISQVGLVVDNTIKTRYLFEINKGSNKIPDIDVNAAIPEDERRIPFENMVYVADGPSDVPVFSVVKRGGGRAYAVYDPGNMEEFAQNDHLLQAGRIHSYGPADYTEGSSTANWIKLHLDKICEDVLIRQQRSLKKNVSKAPRHLPRKDQTDEPLVNPQPELFEGEG